MPCKGNPVCSLVKSVLIEERLGSAQFQTGSYVVKFSLSNDYDLVFAAVYNKALPLQYVDELLEVVRGKFVSQFREVLDEAKLKKRSLATFDFGSVFAERFKKLCYTIEDKYKGRRANSSNAKKAAMKHAEASEANDEDEDEDEDEIAQPSTAADETDALSEKDRIQANLDRLRQKKLGKGKQAKVAAEPTVTKSKPVKKKRSKADGSATKEELEALDFSKKDSATDIDVEDRYGGTGAINLDYSSSEDDEAEEADSQPSKSAGGIWGFFAGLTGSRVLSKENLEPVLEKMRSHLIEKNVAKEISDKLCESIELSLTNKTMGSFTSVSTTVKTAMEDALTRILTPKRNIDILREVQAKNDEKHKPYVIVMVGVNGVGKSTSLAKICSWLRQNDKKVMIAACDTFRSGAVEQLAVHSRCLNVPLFSQGYGKDAASVAHAAIKKASEEGVDVVMVDTAGRMQDNEPLMRSLTKLVSKNEPDLILFVGEALVGNEAVDQIVKFNAAMSDFSAEREPRLIDGIMLTKFDTIDDKVGAAISMVYTTGQPVIFVGTGQHYSDLKKLNVKTVVKTLLK